MSPKSEQRGRYKVHIFCEIMATLAELKLLVH